MKAEKLQPIEKGETPLKYGGDLHSGHSLGSNLYVQYKNADNRRCDRIILTNLETGERLEVRL